MANYQEMVGIFQSYVSLPEGTFFPVGGWEGERKKDLVKFLLFKVETTQRT